MANDKNLALKLGVLLDEHRAADVAVLDLREMQTWTDFFVIATVSSGAHREGLERHIKEICKDEGVEILRHRRKTSQEDGWHLIDLGTIVVHLMREDARSFFELERLWSEAALLMGPRGQ